MLNNVLISITFYLIDAFTLQESLIRFAIKTVKLLVIPLIIFWYIKVIDQEHFDFFIGREARGASVYYIAISQDTEQIIKSQNSVLSTSINALNTSGNHLSVHSFKQSNTQSNRLSN